MSAHENIGPKRMVVGAHYGFKDWLSQRLTAVVMAVFTIVLLGAFLVSKDKGYVAWAGLFSNTWMKMLTIVALVCMSYHMWVGVRDIWMDYVKSTGVRLGLQMATILWIIGCLAYAGQTLLKV
jgi:succinate dehydrogenase / fumarate reductase, membrane anchor subunit